MAAAVGTVTGCPAAAATRWTALNAAVPRTGPPAAGWRPASAEWPAATSVRGAVESETVGHHHEQRAVVEERELLAEELGVGLRLAPERRDRAEIRLGGDDRHAHRKAARGGAGQRAVELVLVCEVTPASAGRNSDCVASTSLAGSPSARASAGSANEEANGQRQRRCGGAQSSAMIADVRTVHREAMSLEAICGGPRSAGAAGTKSRRRGPVSPPVADRHARAAAGARRASRHRSGARPGGSGRLCLSRQDPPGSGGHRRQGRGRRPAHVDARPGRRDRGGDRLPRGPVPAVLTLGRVGERELVHVLPQSDAGGRDATNESHREHAAPLASRQRGTLLRVARRPAARARRSGACTGRVVCGPLERAAQSRRTPGLNQRRAVARRRPVDRLVLADHRPGCVRAWRPGACAGLGWTRWCRAGWRTPSWSG